MSQLSGIRNFLELDDQLATSGMPRPEDFDTMRTAGFDVVINLAMPTSDNAMANEGDLVTRAGMTYVHIPVNFEAPRPADFDSFSQILDLLRGRKVYVHCAANMRVSAFVFLHRILRDEMPRTEAEHDLNRIWNPDGVWRRFIDQRLTAAGKPPLS